MTSTIATWNINSIRSHLSVLKRFLKNTQPEILCLQETKVQDELFPAEALVKLGYPHVLIHGQKSYHGVAIISRNPLHLIEKRSFAGLNEARHLSCETIIGANKVIVHNLYVPAGGYDANPTSEKFRRKLQFLDDMITWSNSLSSSKAHRILVGDLNVAPLAQDVWDHKYMLKVVSHTPIETGKFSQFVEAAWVDTIRHLEAEKQLFTWWSYRSRNWRKDNMGRRLDHILISPSLVPHVGSYDIYKITRGWVSTSDHVPLTLTIK